MIHSAAFFSFLRLLAHAAPVHIVTLLRSNPYIHETFLPSTEEDVAVDVDPTKYCPSLGTRLLEARFFQAPINLIESLTRHLPCSDLHAGSCDAEVSTTMGEFDDGYNIGGFAGGLILAAALLPQIYLAIRHRSTAYISYVWQVSSVTYSTAARSVEVYRPRLVEDRLTLVRNAIHCHLLCPSPFPPSRPRCAFTHADQAVYALGLGTLMLYYIHFQLWSVFYPMAFEFCCLLFLTGLKIYNEVFLGRVAAPMIDDTPGLEVVRGGPVRWMPSIKLSLEVLKNDMSRSGRIGRMPSKLSLGAPSHASRSRMGASVTSSTIGDDHTRSSYVSRSRMGASVVSSSLGDDHTQSAPNNVFMPALGRREGSSEFPTETTGNRAGDTAVRAGDHV